MIVTKLELVDFRNYAAASFEFHHGITAVVGLNGQGKTNLAEALAYTALNRRETRGGHAREDYPTRDDENFLAHSMLYKGNDGELHLSTKPVTITRYQPMERKY